MKKILTCVALSAILLSGCSFAKSGIIQVNDVVITKSQFDKAIDKELDNSPFKAFGGADNFVKSDDNFMYVAYKEKVVKELIVKALLDAEIDKRKIKVSEEDIDEIKDMDISVAHCPVSNLKLGCGIAKVKYMLDNGINVALGTDGQGSGSNLDLFEAMKFTALLQKGVTENPECMPAYEVLKMATINGAKALGLEEKIGTIEEGKLADIIIIDIDDVKIKPINDLISEIVYNVKGSNVVTTIVNGKILMENRKLLIDKEKQIYEECDKIIKRISE